MKHLGRSYAALTEDTTRVMGAESAVSQPGHRLRRQEAVWIAASGRMVSAVKREWISAVAPSDSIRNSICCNSCAAKLAGT